MQSGFVFFSSFRNPDIEENLTSLYDCVLSHWRTRSLNRGAESPLCMDPWPFLPDISSLVRPPKNITHEVDTLCGCTIRGLRFKLSPLHWILFNLPPSSVSAPGHIRYASGIFNRDKITKFQRRFSWFWIILHPFWSVKGWKGSKSYE